MLLGHEKSIKVPEARIDESRCCQSSGINCVVRMCSITYLDVGISTKSQLKKIFLNSSLTLLSGCRAPAFCEAPRALKLYGLKLAVFQLPSSSISAVRSVCSTGISFAHLEPLRTVYAIDFCVETSLRLRRSLSCLGSEAALWVCTCWRICCVLSVTVSAIGTRSSPSFLIHFNLKALPWPTFADSGATFCYSRCASATS